LTSVALNVPVSLIVNPDKSGFAVGTLYVDANGDSNSDLTNNRFEYYRLMLSDNSLKVFLEGGTIGSVQGSNNTLIDTITIANAANLANASFACSISEQWDIVQLAAPAYNATTQTLNIKSSSGAPLNISEVRQIFYGGAGDLNLCDSTSYTYIIKTDVNNTAVNLTTNHATFTLEHKAKTLPNLTLSLQLVGASIVNYNISYENTTLNTLRHRKVDIGSDLLSLTANETLDNFVKLSAPGADFTLEVFTANLGLSVYRLTSLVFDDFFMIHGSAVSIAPLSDNSTTGVWGLGERVSSFFYADGVYTSLARDAGSPFDNGKTPGNSMYGHHPIYFGRAAENAYFGVFNLNADAADFYIKNSLSSTAVNQVTIGGIFDVYIITATTPDKAVQLYHSIVGAPVMIP
jgi:hypothetical protein